MDDSYLMIDPCILTRRGWLVNNDSCDNPRLCSIAAAVLGAGALGAGAQIFGANKAAGAQTAATTAATQQQRQMFDIVRNLLDPFVKAGQGGIDKLQGFIDPSSGSSPLNALMRLVMPGANMSETLAQTPGFQFAEDRGLRSVNNALAARGLGGSGGAVAKGAGDYVTGLASGTWKDVVDRLMGVFTGGTGALQNLVTTGANAAAGVGTNATDLGKSIGANLIGAGNAQAGAATATGNALAGLGGTAGTAAILQKLLGGTGAPGGGMYGGSPDSNPLLNPATYGNV